MDEDDTFNALRRTPFRQVVKECLSRKTTLLAFTDNDEYIRSQGWPIREFSDKLDKLSNAEWLEIVGEPARGTDGRRYVQQTS